MTMTTMNTPVYSVNVVNANYRLTHDKPINLKNTHLLFPSNSKLYVKPSQLVIKDDKGTILLFGNGNMRIMGCIDELEATFLAYKYTMMLDGDDCNFQPVYSQSMTVRVAYNSKINLNKFVCESRILPLQYEPELFPAVLLKKYKPISVNVFSSGKIIMCGVRNVEQVDDIMQDLILDLENCKFI
jgi:TATA-box binding protein (TBP) (component of TFIID and TFIIIB)